MRFDFLVSVEVERVSGRFASRDAIASEIEEALTDADLQQVSVDDSEYETIAWDVEEQPQPKPVRRRKVAAP